MESTTTGRNGVSLFCLAAPRSRTGSFVTALNLLAVASCLLVDFTVGHAAAAPAISSGVVDRNGSDVTVTTAAALANTFGCRAESGIRIRINLWFGSTLLSSSGSEIQRIVDQVWKRHGIIVEWVNRGAAATARNVDASVVVRDDPVVPHKPTALGAVNLTPTGPGRLIRLSAGAAIDWVQRLQADQRKLSRPLGRRFGLLLDDAAALAMRTLGYAAAHELGHILLQSKRHARSGLMSPSFVSLPRLDRDPREIALDVGSRERLLERLSQVGGCAERVSPGDD